MKFKEIIKYLMEGKKIRRKSWNPNKCRYLDNSKETKVMRNQKGKAKSISPEFLFFDDWEIYEEPKTKGTLGNKIIFNGRKEYHPREDHAILIRSDVKEKIQNAQKRLKENIRKKLVVSKLNWTMDEIDKIFKEEFGEGLLK